MSELQQYTLEQVAEHNTRQSPWIVIHDKVYDVQRFLEEHPGGEEVLLEPAGKDCTEAFEDVGHSTDAKDLMQEYLIGEIVEHQRSKKQIKTKTYEDVVSNNQDSSNWTQWVVMLGLDSFSALIGLLANTNCQQSIESDELKLSVEHCAMKFIEKGKDMETFFLQKRFQLLSQKPENLIIEDIAEIKNEIARKDNLIERFNQKLETWQQILDDNYPISNQQTPHNPMLINQNQQMMNLQSNNLQNNLQNNNLQNNMQANLQNSQLTPHQSISAASIRQRSPIQQPIQNMPIHNTGLRQIMSPHHSYTPQLQNQSPMMNMQHSPAMSQDSPQMHSIQQQQSTSYAPTNQQQQSHLAFLEKLIKKE